MTLYNVTVLKIQIQTNPGILPRFVHCMLRQYVEDSCVLKVAENENTV
jgi:hypothetical protein